MVPYKYFVLQNRKEIPDLPAKLGMYGRQALAYMNTDEFSKNEWSEKQKEKVAGGIDEFVAFMK